MYCNEIRNKIVIFILLMTTIQIVTTKQYQKEIQKQQNNNIDMVSQLDEGTSGDLYNIFKKRLQVIQTELAYHKFNDLEQQKIQDKRNLNARAYEILYNKKLKQQLKYKNLTDNPLVLSSTRISTKSKNDKRSAVRREFYELYRRKMDQLNNVSSSSSLDSERVVDRSGRSFFNWFQKDSKNNEKQYNKILNDKVNHQFKEQQLTMSKTINETNEDSSKLLDILKKESNLTNSIENRDELHREFMQQMEIINNAMTPLEKRYYSQVFDLQKNYNNYDQNWLQDEDIYDNTDWDFENQNKDYEFWNLLPKKITSFKSRKRQLTTNNANTNAVYPSVLTKALEISLSPSVHSNSNGSLLAKVAQQMNTSTLDLAEKLAKSTDSPNDGHLAQMVQNIMTNDNHNSNGVNMTEIFNTPVAPNQFVAPQLLADQNSTAKVYKPIVFQGAVTTSPVQIESAENLPAYSKNEENPNGLTTSNLTKILDRVLSKLESIHDGKKTVDDEHPDGAPCDIIGSWSSVTLGLCFDIKLNMEKMLRTISPAEVNNQILSIEAQECTPQRSHQVVDLEWKFGGSALKTMGGPFYIYAQKRSESLVGTFLGYCRICGGIDTIYGAWTFSSPSRNYYDISLAFDVKRDLLRRDRMEIKRKERVKELLYQSRSGKLKKSLEYLGY